MVGLRIFADQGIVVRRPGRLHRAESYAADAAREETFAYQPVRPLRRLPLGVLLEQRTEYVGHMFVQRAGLVLIFESGGKLCYAVRQFVADYVDAFRKAIEDLAIAVAVNHLLTIPEGVIEIAAKMNGGIEPHPTVVDRVPIVDHLVEVIGLTGSREGLVYADIGALSILFTTHELAGQGLAVLRVED